MRSLILLIKNGIIKTLNLEKNCKKLMANDKEFEEMSKKEVWEVIKKEDIHKNRRNCKCK